MDALFMHWHNHVGTLALSAKIMINLLVLITGWSYLKAIRLGYKHSWHQGIKEVERGISASTFGLKFVPLQYLVIYNISLLENLPKIFSYGFSRYFLMASLYFLLKKFRILFMEKIEN